MAERRAHVRSGMTADERRRTRRVAVELAVEEHTGQSLYFQRASNLSTGGLFLEGTLPHPLGTRLELSIQLPGERPLSLVGEVAGAGPGGVGMAVRFVEPSAVARLRLCELLDGPPSSSMLRTA